MSISVDLRKATDVVVDLTKNKGIFGQKAQVVLAIDYSGSMSQLYSSGLVQRVVERLVPIAMAFDDDESLEVHRFSTDCTKISTNVTPTNLDGYVKKYVDNGYMGGTNYAPAINSIIKNMDVNSSGFLKSLFGGNSKKTSDLPTYVIFITDGENSDVSDTKEAMVKASYQGAFFQFVGISRNGNGRFSQLEDLDNMRGRLIDNANFFQLSNDDLDKLSDNDLYNKLLTEFPSWVKLAKNENLIK